MVWLDTQQKVMEDTTVSTGAAGFTPTCILVTGGCGFIGSQTTIELCRVYPTCKIVVYDRLDYCGSRQNLAEVRGHPYLKLVEGDLNESDLLAYILRNEKVDTVIHMAAQTHVDNSFSNSMAFTRDNILGTQSLLEVVREAKYPVKRFIHVSTDEVYGHTAAGSGHGMPDANEGMALEPTNPYSASKVGRRQEMAHSLTQLSSFAYTSGGSGVSGHVVLPHVRASCHDHQGEQRLWAPAGCRPNPDRSPSPTLPNSCLTPTLTLTLAPLYPILDINCYPTVKLTLN